MTGRSKSSQTVDWNDLATGPLCNDLLFTNLDQNEISELIGFATHYSSKEQDANPQRQISPQQRQNVNALQDFGLAPTTSLQVLSQSEQPQHENPLLGLPSIPLPPSHLHYLSRRTLSIPEFDKKLEQTFADSALIAIGMFLEEMITASLLPLAGYHVLRCRELGELSTDLSEAMDGLLPGHDKSDCRLLSHPITGLKIKSDSLLVEITEKPFDEWTLPPEEAMLKLLEQNVIPADGLEFLPSPTRSAIASQKLSGQVPTNEWQSIQKWSKTQNLDPYYVVKNMDVYRLFLKMRSLQNRWKG
jgi:hypothetical protein